jgi:uncharacterized damage-inducible protein DinB
MGRIKWSGRRFDFTFPVELYPELIERLRGTPARVADRLQPVPGEQLIRRPGRGWSPQEHAGHLADLDENLFLPRLDEYAARVTTLRAADMSNRQTEVANHNGRPLAEVLGQLRRARAAVVARLESLDADAFGQVAFHPRLHVSMRLVDLMFFHAEHDDYHLASISELLRAGAKGEPSR